MAKLLPRKSKQIEKRGKRRRFPLNSHRSSKGSSESFTPHPQGLRWGCVVHKARRGQICLKTPHIKSKNHAGFPFPSQGPLGHGKKKKTKKHFPMFLCSLSTLSVLQEGDCRGGPHVPGAGGGPARPGLFLAGGWPGRACRAAFLAFPFPGDKERLETCSSSLAAPCTQGPAAGATPGKGCQ